MLRTLLAGAVAAFVGNKLIKMNKEGKFEPAKQRLRERAGELREHLAEQQDALFSPALPARAPAASRRARTAPSDNVSKPAPAHPWPIDPKAMPEA